MRSYLVYLDCNSSKVNENRELKKEYSVSVDPNIEGYKVMETLAKEAINKAL